ncbi:MAG: prepilin-type N-terminal cleavage/methylation domain-containing protein [Candidatus Hydrogenedentes bacterium]|nr:prepilin-type N-terminal cleavage/methylation domain-containing protein [Candidatus Hydrogenedentota bacterium]
MGRTNQVSGRLRRLHTTGFTLLEVIVALGVVSVAISVIVAMFSGSLTLGASSRSANAAGVLAEERLIDLQRNPAGYDWAGLADCSPGELAPIVAKDEETGRIDPPRMGEAAGEAIEDTAAFFERFTWRAYAKKPEADAPYLQVIVIVGWPEQARERSFALTGIMPCRLVEGAQ